MPDDKLSASFGPQLKTIYEKAWTEFTFVAPDLLAADPPPAWSDAFNLQVAHFLPATAAAWAALLQENPWLIDGDYWQADVAEPYPELREVLRAVLLCVLSDAMLEDVDARLPAVGAAIEAGLNTLLQQQVPVDLTVIQEGGTP